MCEVELDAATLLSSHPFSAGQSNTQQEVERHANAVQTLPNDAVVIRPVGAVLPEVHYHFP